MSRQARYTGKHRVCPYRNAKCERHRPSSEVWRLCGECLNEIPARVTIGIRRNAESLARNEYRVFMETFDGPVHRPPTARAPNR